MNMPFFFLLWFNVVFVLRIQLTNILILWRFCVSDSVQEDQLPQTKSHLAKSRDRLVSRIMATIFLMLSFYVSLHALEALRRGAHPDPSNEMLTLSLWSIAIFSFLSSAKYLLSHILRSMPLRYGFDTLLGGYNDLTDV